MFNFDYWVWNFTTFVEQTRVLQPAEVFRFSGTASLTNPAHLLLRTSPDQVTSSLTIDNLISGSTVII
jgi:hypothetical protein